MYCAAYVFLNDLNLFCCYLLDVGWPDLLPKLTRDLFLCNRLWLPNVFTYSARHASRGTLRFATGNVLVVEPHLDKMTFGRSRYDASPKLDWFGVWITLTCGCFSLVNIIIFSCKHLDLTQLPLQKKVIGRNEAPELNCSHVCCVWFLMVRIVSALVSMICLQQVLGSVNMM